ncbi:MAG: hypothetical protein IPK13_09865 [Deltaproteobacteria bacterium]|nr:hypothetical protein [Deltaproteobacteria bacterium]
MFVGHFAAALAAKRAAPRVSLGVLFIGCQFLDLLWPVLVLAGVETVHVDTGATAFNPLVFDSYPWSHSLGMTAVWSLAAIAICKLTRCSRREAMTMAILVMSHWVLDFISHTPDLPVWPGSDLKVGLSLWNSVAATVIIELGFFAVGIWIFVTTAGPTRSKRRWAFWGLIGFLFLMYLATAFGPKPNAGTPAAAIAGPAIAMWLLVAWAHWADWGKKTEEKPRPRLRPRKERLE